jgi:protease-4
MKPFWRSFFASSLALIIIGGLLVILLVGGIASAVSGVFKPEDKVKIEENSVLHIQFKNPISELSYTEFDKQALSLKQAFGLREVKLGLEKAKTDDEIKGILINSASMPAGMATTEEVRNAILDFKAASGKFVIAYGETFTQKAYYLATVADSIYLYPEGMVEFQGLGVEYMFFKNAIDKLGLDVQIIRGSNNKFKSAVEPFMYDHMSDANREQTMTYLTALWDQMLAGITDTRGISKVQLNEIADSVYVRSAETAKKYKLVDDLIYEDELFAKLEAKSGTKEDAELSLISFENYCAKAAKKQKSELKLEDKNIAVVYAVGGIESGKGGPSKIGSETIAKAIRDARNDENIKAIVLRVNSPGGSALASDVIWREMVLAKEKMPVVISMGDVAASGGYYISCQSDRIFAQPNTITGSIGVFGIIPNISKPLEEKLGVTLDRAYTNRPTMMTITRALTDEEYSIVQEGVDDIYMDFKQKVADGRPGLDVAGVDSIGQGRVWAGTDALKIGLVDELGGIDEAVAYAAKKAEVKEVKISVYPKKKQGKFMEILDQFDMDASASVMSPIAQKIASFMLAVEKATATEGVQARLPYDIIIE